MDVVVLIGQVQSDLLMELVQKVSGRCSSSEEDESEGESEGDEEQVVEIRCPPKKAKVF